MNINNNLYLKDISKNRDNNFDFLRFLAASLVIFSHSFPLSGNGEGELLSILTCGQETFGSISVKIFFIISGYLITQSFLRTNNIFKFMKARILRIFPALIVVILICTFILGPLVTNLSILTYLKNIDTYKYLESISLIRMKYELPGVFDTNVYKNAVNGSLWTLMYEFGCYLLVGFLGFTKLLKKPFVLTLFTANYILYLFRPQSFLLLFTLYFITGMVFYIFRDNIKIGKIYIFLSIFLIILFTRLNVVHYILPIAGSYLLFCFSFNNKFKFSNFSKNGDYSYGLYIYAFPIQQVVVYLLGGSMNNYFNFIISFPITLAFAFLSWNIIEKQFLKLKDTSFFPCVSQNRKLLAMLKINP